MLPPELAREVRARLDGPNDQVSPTAVVSVLRDLAPLLGESQLVAAAHGVMGDLSGLGPLRDLIALPNVTDVVVNGCNSVWLDRGSGMELSGVTWRDENELRTFAVRLAGRGGRRLDDVQPYAEFSIGDSLRCHIVVPPLAPQGTCLSVRVARRIHRDLASLVVDQPPIAGDVLAAIVRNRRSFLVTGGTGSGKTTVLRAMLAEVPHAERLVVIEDTAEIFADHPHQVTLQSRGANAEGIGEVTLRTLVRQALRMRPDRLVLGEVRGAEIVDLFAAMNSGHEGACATLHANAAGDVVARVEALGMMAGLPRDAVAVQFEAAVQIVLHMQRTANGQRRLAEVGAVRGGRVRRALVIDQDTHHYAGAWHDLEALL